MMKRVYEKIVRICSIIAFSILTIYLYSRYLDMQITQLYEQKEDQLSLISGIPEKDKGSAWIKESGESGDIFVFGSSELSSPVRQNIKNNFPNEDYPHNISAIGHAYVQNGLHAMDIGANYESIKENDIVVVESIQWFFNDDIGADAYMANFSEFQFYEFLHNSKISEENKDYLCNRFLDLESQRTTYAQIAYPEEPTLLKRLWYKVMNLGIVRIVGIDYDYPQTHLLAKLYVSDNVFEKGLYHIMRPYYYLRYEIMNLKDKRDTYYYLKTIDSGQQKDILSTDWEAQLERAQREGEQSCTNNDLYVYDEYYMKDLQPEWDNLANFLEGTTVFESKEWDDLKFLLSVCNDLELHPYFINASTNGRYYDYAGIDSATRQEYYDKLEDTVDKYGLESYNELKDMEYTPYVYADVMHLGWKGWIYVTEAITEHFSK